MQTVSTSTEPAAEYALRGGGGLHLHVQEWGDPQGPALLLIHGWSQSKLCWRRQVESGLAETFRIVTFDNRGHGMSDRPLTPEHYADGQLWADDVAAIIEQTELKRPILVAWSYGGFVVADYVRAYGEAGVGGGKPPRGAPLLQAPGLPPPRPRLLGGPQGEWPAGVCQSAGGGPPIFPPFPPPAPRAH